MSQAEITAVNRIFEDSVRRRDVERIASIYTADAIALPPGDPSFKDGRTSSGCGDRRWKRWK